MPPKKNNLTYSISPELYARAHQPACTIAMGMKGTQASSQCWVNQVHREEAIHDGWVAKYDPEDRQDREALAALERTQARDAARKEAYLSPTSNPEIHTLLYKDKKASVVPSTADATMSAGASPNGLHSSSVNTTQPASSWEAEAASSLKVRRSAEEYLEARCDHYTLQQRFPDGPATAAQAVGWAAATDASAGASSIAATSRVAPHRRPAGAYRKPEDEEHAALLGFDYTPK